MADIASSKLVLCGAGRFGNELAAWVRRYALPFEFLGFLDDEKSTAGVIGPLASADPAVGARYAISVGAAADRKVVARALQQAGVRLANIVSPYSMLAEPIGQDAGIVILGNASVANDVTLGEHVLIHGYSAIGHEVSVGRCSAIGAFVFVGGRATIGEAVTIHPHATILPNVKIGEGAIIGAGSVVIRNVEAHTTVTGNPARLLVRRNS